MNAFKNTITFLFSVICGTTLAQNFEITNFQESLQDVISTNVKDNNGNDCAIIKFSTEDKGFSVDNALNIFENAGDLYVYLPEGTEAITIRHRVHRTLFYHIPLHIQSGCHYTATIDIIDKNLIGKVDPDKFLYAEAGINIFPFLGPNLVIGYRMKSFSAELGLTYGFNKTDELFFYNIGATIKSAYNYQALRVAMHLGYTQPLSRQIFLTPQVGMAYNNIAGQEIKDVTATDRGYMDGFKTLSATFGGKLTFSFSGRFGLCITSEYNLGITKNVNYDIVKKADDMMKNWTDGFCLSAALVYKF